jgi:hypothetical protein
MAWTRSDQGAAESACAGRAEFVAAAVAVAVAQLTTWTVMQLQQLASVLSDADGIPGAKAHHQYLSVWMG